MTKKNLCGKIATGLLAGCLAGCVINPKAGDFDAKKSIAFPSHPIIMALFAGEYQSEKGKKDNQTYIDIKRMHWLRGELADSKIYLPKNAEMIGMKEFLGSFWVSYDLDGQRRLNKYDMGERQKAVLSEQYLWDNNKNKFDRLR